MLSDLLYRLRSLLRRSTVERELSEELRFHYDSHVEKGMRAGLSRQESMRQARLAVGAEDEVREECRDARGVWWIESVAADLRHAVRGLVKAPAFTAVVVLSLAIGIGANSAIFSLMDAVMWRLLPIQDPKGLYMVGTRYDDGTGYGHTYRDYRLIAANGPWFHGVAAYGSARFSVSVNGSMEPASDGQLVTGGYFALLGVKAVAGRTLGPDDDRLPGGHPVAMISHGYWERRFASDPSVVGRTITLCGAPFTIVGVTPRDFFGVEVGTSPDFFAPAMMQPVLMPASENFLLNPINQRRWLRPLVRLVPGASPVQVEPLLDAMYKAGKAPDGKELPQDRWKIVLTPAANGISDLRRQFSQPLAVLMAMVGALLLMACANAASMLLARSAARAPEFAMRLSLGAGRWRLMQQVLVESMLLAVGGGVLGLLLARQLAHLLVLFLSAGRTPITLDVEPDLRVLAFTVAVTAITGILFGLLPALRSSGRNVSLDLKGLAGTSGERQHALRPGKLLVVSQVVLSMMLLAAASLFARSLQKLSSQDAGFPRESILTMRVEPRGSDQRNIPGTVSRLDRTYRALQDGVQSIQGVRSASLAQVSPTSGVTLQGGVQLPNGEQTRISTLMVYPRYFETMGIGMVDGRDFRESDLSATSPPTAIVNETFARRAFGNTNPIGRTFDTLGGRGRATREIIGVVKDSVYTNLRGKTPAVIFQPFLQTSTGRGQMVLHARIDRPGSGVVHRIREEVQKIDPALPLFEIRSLAEEMDGVMVRERMMAALAGFFGAVALTLACVGLYGLVSFGVIRRTREVGVRMALGASGRDVIGMVMGEVAVLLAAGLAIGVPASFALAHFASSQISGLLFGLTPTDPVSLGIAAAALVLVTAVAGFFPARRASRVEPVAALRSE